MEIIKNTAKQNTQDFITLYDLFHICVNKWHWFVISLVVCSGIGIYYLLITPPIYTRNASLLIKDDSKGKSASSDMGSFDDMGLFDSNADVNSEVDALKSRDLMHEVVSRLRLNMDYHVGGLFRHPTVYGNELPITAEILGFPETGSADFFVQLSGNGQVSLSDFKRDGEEVGTDVVAKGRLRDIISTPLGKVVIRPSESYKNGYPAEIYVSQRPLEATAAGYSSRLNVSLEDEKSNVITLTFNDVSIQRADKVLNTLITVYNENWLKDKNQAAVSTSMFINERLGVIEGELGNVDSNISSFKSQNLVPDLGEAATMYMNQASQATASISALQNQLYMVRYIKNYLANEKNQFSLLPANTGIDNSEISTLMKDYNDKLLERNTLVSQSSVKNPLVVVMDRSLTDMRATMMHSIDNQLVSLETQIRSQSALGGQANSKIASNPKQSKYLLSVERQQKVKESLYLYLLQKREENELSQAFTPYNTRIITKPGGSSAPTAPVNRNILAIALLLGVLIPTVIIFLKEMLNTKVRGRKDLDNMTIPFVGEIPLAGGEKKRRFGRKQHSSNVNVAVKEGSRDIINEAFRVVRANMEFMLNMGHPSKVIMVTSANPGSGKTFTTFNLAASFSIKGKKVLILDLDLRMASLSKYIDKPKVGISNYLVGKVNSDEIIYKHESIPNLSIIPVGTLPPNPTELLYDSKLETLIANLRNEYDYIFVDCPPVEVVADATIISKWVDTTLFVIRTGLLERSMLPDIQALYDDKKYHNLCMLLNGTEYVKGKYGYNHGYGYVYSKTNH